MRVCGESIAVFNVDGDLRGISNRRNAPSVAVWRSADLAEVAFEEGTSRRETRSPSLSTARYERGTGRWKCGAVTDSPVPLARAHS